MDDDEDEVVMRLPVMLRPGDANLPICLFQYPLRPRYRPYRLDEIKSARARPQQKQIELTLGNECSPSHYDKESNRALANITLTSTTQSARTSYAVGMVHADDDGVPQSVNITPLSSTVQLRPSFAAFDQSDAKGKGVAQGSGSRTKEEEVPATVAEAEALDEGEDEDEGGDETSTLTPLFRPAQTEREIEARRSSHAYLVEQREAEPWSEAKLHPPDREFTERVFSAAAVNTGV